MRLPDVLQNESAGVADHGTVGSEGQQVIQSQPQIPGQPSHRHHRVVDIEGEI
jgi:hypothetical protein